MSSDYSEFSNPPMERSELLTEETEVLLDTSLLLGTLGNESVDDDGTEGNIELDIDSLSNDEDDTVEPETLDTLEADGALLCGCIIWTIGVCAEARAREAIAG